MPEELKQGASHIAALQQAKVFAACAAGLGMFTVPSQSLISYHVSQFQLLEEVSKPLWIYRCVFQVVADLYTHVVPSGMATL